MPFVRKKKEVKTGCAKQSGLPSNVEAQLCRMITAMRIDPAASTQPAIRLPRIPVTRPSPFTSRSLRWSWANTFAAENWESVMQYRNNKNLTPIHSPWSWIHLTAFLAKKRKCLVTNGCCYAADRNGCHVRSDAGRFCKFLCSFDL